MDFERIKHIGKKRGVGDCHCKLLYGLAKESIGTIVEIGSLMGRSTACLALGSLAGGKNEIYAIDPWELKTTYDFDNYFNVFWENMVKARVDHIIHPIKDFSCDFLEKVSKHDQFNLIGNIGLLFVDGGHGHPNVKKDLAWIKFVKKGGIVAFHDYKSKKIRGVNRAVNEYLKENKGILKEIDICQSLIVFKKL
jgi:predicted O-methyltransferase YrrM